MKFYVRDTFNIPSRNLFVLAGSIVEGTVRPGMSVRIPFNKGFSHSHEVCAIEFARRHGGEDVCLCLRYSDDDELDFLKGLNIGDETIAID